MPSCPACGPLRLHTNANGKGYYVAESYDPPPHAAVCPEQKKRRKARAESPQAQAVEALLAVDRVSVKEQPQARRKYQAAVRGKRGTMDEIVLAVLKERGRSAVHGDGE